MATSAAYIDLDEGAAPATPAAGKVRVYAKTDGSAYQKDDAGTETGLATGGGGGSQGTELAYTAYTANVNPTATVEASADTVVTASAVVFDGSTVVMVEFFCPIARANASAGATMNIWLFDNGTSIGTFAVVGQGTTQANEYKPVMAARRLTPSAASHTYSARATVSTGTGVVGAGNGTAANQGPGYIRIVQVSA